MNDLTEKWKKGELSVGEYYLLYKDGTTDREYYDWANVYGRVTEKGFSTDQNDIKEVLAEVPDYVEWRNMVNCACEEHEANKRLIEENAQLKEQINKCYLDAINSGTANAVKAVKEFGMPEKYFIADLLESEVFTDEGEKLGILEDIYNTGSCDIYVVKNELGKSILLPRIDDVIKEIDVENKKITVHLIEGLI